MIFKLACGDVMPGCAARFESRDRDTLMGAVVGHAASAHGMTNLTDDVLASIQSKIAVAA
jgi:predicted small metal-binding protein